MINRGSDWARWDLHVHTKGTAKNDQFKSQTLDDFFQIFFSKAIEKNIKVIGITDYFNIENYKKAYKYQELIENSTFFDAEQKKKIKAITLIPNIELRITPTTGKGSLINIHILINPEIIADFEELFLTQAHMIIDERLRFSLTRRGLIGLGKHHYPHITNDDQAYFKGIEQFSLAPKDIVEILEKNKLLKENCLIFVSNGTNDGVSGLKTHEEILAQQQASASELRNSIYRISDGLFSPKPSDLKYFLGKGTDPVNEIIRKYGSLKPCIHGSDAHTETKLFEPDNQQFCWIKAEPTFEGLKQILHEPETRVHIGAIQPEHKNDYEVIDCIQLNHEFVYNQIIYFNQNLTSIIGGRSSGKSTLLQCLANKLQPTALDEKPDHLDGLCKELKIIWKDGREDDSRQIEYFYQGHMYRKSRDEGIEEIVERLLLQKNPRLFDEHREKIADINLKISGDLSSYFSLKVQIDQKKSLLQSIGNIEDVKAQISTLNNKINSLKTADISEEELVNYEIQKNLVASISSEIDAVSSLKNLIEGITINNLISFHPPFNYYPSYSIIGDIIEQKINLIREYATEQIQEMKNISLNNLQNNYNQKIQERMNILTDSQFSKVSNYLSNSKSLEPIFKQKELEELKAKRIHELMEEIERLQKEEERLINLVHKNWLSLEASYEKVLYEINNIEISTDLKITSKKVFESNIYQDWISKNINQRGEKAQSYMSYSCEKFEELLNIFNDLKTNINKGTIRFRQGTDIESFTKEFFDKNWFKFKYDVIYENDNYKTMSQGKKAFVILKMTLDCSDSKCPIIIDQPEDDLDNRAIYSELVAYLKEKKSQRQIILVTHNANVVVNADSELVIVANQHGSQTPNNDERKFQYKFGSIECLLKSDDTNSSTLDRKRIKEHICEILEGGHQAFKLRERKYNMN
ncbi:TPA: hypothetical protein OUJ26_000145 [Acinetobacter baumannii]|nr:hypothetical protein [Acinetobacter baumannii]